MEPIHSGTTRERLVRAALGAVLVCGYSAWSLWDGYIAYPRENVEAVFQSELGIQPPDPLPVINPELTSLSVAAYEGASLESIEVRLGAPAHRSRDQIYYLAPGGYVSLELRSSRVRVAAWHDGPSHSSTDLMWQKGIGFALAPIGCLLLINLCRAVTLRVTLTDAGLKLRGKPIVPFDAMKGIKPGKNSETVVLEYRRDGRDGVAQLDGYVVKEQASIVTAICRRTGFTDPFATSEQVDAKAGDAS